MRFCCQDFINAGQLEYYFLPRVAPVTVPLMQVTLYELCLRHSAGLHTFIAFIDVDEYLVPSPADRPKKLDGLLREFEGFAGVALKSIVNTRFAIGVTSDPHHFRYAGGRAAQTTAGEPVQASSSRAIAADRLVLYHYATKSASQFEAKMLKGSAMGNRKGLDFLKRIEGASTHRCLDALTACIEYGAPSCKDAHLAMKPP
ncbi:hypothetical protein QBZ16_003846 [Prototheca wickerhamii]|uniref:Glycosyltransferase family 92 protein n=1 Tax=Prototheca wickerhamii TaxID=3111 RepID=A0AAD9IGQ8_PROWI|nr:hypothetical protein QBZ16_003846 [Prototheca wickerhamii]